MKYVRNDHETEGVFTSQYVISDELGDIWRKNGNQNVSDKPWPDLKIVDAYFVADSSTV